MPTSPNKVFCAAIEQGDLASVKRMLNKGANPRAAASRPLWTAAASGHLKIVKLLLPLSDHKTGATSALRVAASNGHLEVVKLLLSIPDPKADTSTTLALAAESGHLEIVKLLLPLSKPKADNSRALQLAAEDGHLEIVKLLLPVSNPMASNSYALRASACNGHMEIVKLLLPFSDFAHMLKDHDFVKSQGCDLLLSCLPQLLVEKFMVDYPQVDFPRARAMLAAKYLHRRPATTSRTYASRARA